MTYRNLKFALSDGVCGSLEGVLPDGPARTCPRLADGLVVTIEILSIAISVGFVLAAALAFARHVRIPVLASLSDGFVYLFRGTPLLAQLWLLYFGLGGLGAEFWGPVWGVVRDGWSVGVIVLTLNTSAYVAELMRGGLANLPRGQTEAAAALGLSRRHAFARILLPQALRAVWPAYGNELILLMKGSALVSTITVMDLMGQTRTVFARSYDLEIYLWAAILYLALAAILTGLHGAVARRWTSRATGRT